MSTRHLTTVGRPSALRCAVCHDALPDTSGATCPDCRTVLHAECRAGLGRCPTLGCRGSLLSAEALAARALEEEERVPPSFWLAVGLSCLTSCFALALHLFGDDPVAAIGLGLLSLPHFIFAPAYWATRVRGRGREEPRGDLLAVVKVLALEVAGCAIVAPTFAHFAASPDRVVSLLASAGLAVAVILGPPAAAWLVGRRSSRGG